MSDGFSSCRKCGKEICFIRTKSGKFMPCEPKAVFYKPGGRTTLYASDGEQINGCELLPSIEGASGSAYLPHWGKCTGAEEIRKERYYARQKQKSEIKKQVEKARAEEAMKLEQMKQRALELAQAAEAEKMQMRLF